MTIGRMLNRTASLDLELNGVSVEAHLLFVMSIPHLDRDGLITGEPLPHLGTVLPLRPDFFQHYEDLITELEQAKQPGQDEGLVIRYKTNKGRVLFFPGFHKNQKITYSREGASVFDLPPGYIRTDTGLERSTSVVTPEQVASNSGVSQEEITLKLSEVKVSEVKVSEVKDTPDHSPDYPPGFDEFERGFRANLITAVQERDPGQRFVSGFGLADTSKSALLQVMAGGPVLSAKAIDWALDQWEEAKPNERFDARKAGCVNWLLATVKNSYKPGQKKERTNGRTHSGLGFAGNATDAPRKPTSAEIAEWERWEDELAAQQAASA